MPTLEEYKLGDKYMGLWKGDPGVGKSVAAASFPDPLYFFDFDGRMEPVARFWKGKGRRISYDTYHAEDFPKFDSKLETIISLARNGKIPYATIVIDSLTALANAIIRYQIGLRSSVKGSAETKGSKVNKGIIELPEWDEYKGETGALNIMIDELRKLPCHVILTAHQITVISRNPITNEEIVSTTLLTAGKKIAAAIPAYFNEVWMFASENSANVGQPPKRKVYTNQGGINYAKTALPVPPSYEIPFGGDLFSKIQESLVDKGIQLRTDFGIK